jgi:RNA polymerase sigma-70 factor (ECF subfamily)
MQEKKNLKEHSDEELMNLYQKGNFAAFEILYERHSGRVFEYLKNKVSNEIAQELLQETFEKLHKSRDSYNNQYPFLPWLFTISRNSVLDFYKKSETRISQSTYNDPNILESIELANSGNTLSPDISEILGGLPANQRRIIELRYLQEWSFEQIAKEIKTSEENARQLLSRSLKNIKSSFKKGGG